MDLKFTQEELDFQSEVRGWLKENYSEDMRTRYGNSPKRPFNQRGSYGMATAII